MKKSCSLSSFKVPVDRVYPEIRPVITLLLIKQLGLIGFPGLEIYEHSLSQSFSFSTRRKLNWIRLRLGIHAMKTNSTRVT